MNKNTDITIICGIDVGDEGKGRITDLVGSGLIGDGYSFFIKSNGSGNAGHVVKIGKETFKLHHIPAGVLKPGAKCLLSSGMTVNPVIFVEEIDQLQQRGIDISNIYISGSAHINFPLYSIIDSQEEDEREIPIGTTRQGNGVAYSMKHARKGVQYWDLINLSKEDFCVKTKKLYQKYSDKLSEEINIMVDDVYSSLIKMKPLIVDSRKIVRDAITNGENILIETSQAVWLDIDEGRYPFVTSTCTSATTSCMGTSIGLHEITRIIGVTKAYSTYVGNGEYIAECDKETGDLLRERGGEYGTTTQRARRIGFTDLVALKTASELNSIDEISLTKIDVLSGFEKIKVVNGYKLDGKIINYVPSNPADYSRCEPVYIEKNGWEEDISGIRSFRDLPENAKEYVNMFEEATGKPVIIISVGPEREQYINRR